MIKSAELEIRQVGPEVLLAVVDLALFSSQRQVGASDDERVVLECADGVILPSNSHEGPPLPPEPQTVFLVSPLHQFEAQLVLPDAAAGVKSVAFQHLNVVAAERKQVESRSRSCATGLVSRADFVEEHSAVSWRVFVELVCLIIHEETVNFVKVGKSVQGKLKLGATDAHFVKPLAELLEMSLLDRAQKGHDRVHGAKRVGHTLARRQVFNALRHLLEEKLLKALQPGVHLSFT